MAAASGYWSERETSFPWRTQRGVIMRKTITTKLDPEIEAIFRTAWRAIRGVAVPMWRPAVAFALIPTFFVVTISFAGEQGPFSTLLVMAYLAAVSLAFSWYIRACLHALHPNAPGTKVGLQHYVWRIAMAWALTMLPAGFVIGLVEGAGIDPNSASIILVSLLAAVLTIGAMTLAAVTSAQVAVAGRFNPLSAYAVTKGHRFKSILSFLMLLACGGGLGALLTLPTVGLSAIGVPEPLPTVLASTLVHLVLLLGLAATSIAILERATYVDAMQLPASSNAG